MAPVSTRWHALDPAKALTELASTSTGLTPEEAARRLARHGPNEVAAAKHVGALSLLAEQFKNVLVVVMLVAIGLSAFLGHGVEAVAIGIIVLFAVGLGFVQEDRAEHALEALRRMAAPEATVVRDGGERRIPARELVPGDVLGLHAGDKVAADGRLLEAVNLQVDEAPLTGGSVPVPKHLEALPDEDLPVGDRIDMVHGGTSVTYGRGRAVMIATGHATEFGRIAKLLESVQVARTPLPRRRRRTRPRRWPRTRTSTSRRTRGGACAATRRRERSSWPLGRRVSTRRRSTSASRGWTRSRSPPRPSE